MSVCRLNPSTAALLTLFQRMNIFLLDQRVASVVKITYQSISSQTLSSTSSQHNHDITKLIVLQAIVVYVMLVADQSAFDQQHSSLYEFAITLHNKTWFTVHYQCSFRWRRNSL